MTKHQRLVALAAALVSCGLSVHGAPGGEGAARSMLSAYIAAWNHADARAIAENYAADGDFISPDGFYARGPAEVEAFYERAFAHGYAGSVARFDIKLVRQFEPDAIVVDGLWSIEGAPGSAGRLAQPERGLATAVIVRRRQGWRVALLREQSSAHRLDVPPNR